MPRHLRLSRFSLSKVLMMVTNTMKNDFKHSNAHVAGLALCALGNISSADIARDLSSEIGTCIAVSFATSVCVSMFFFSEMESLARIHHLPLKRRKAQNQVEIGF